MLLSVVAAARELSVSAVALRRVIWRGEIPVVRVGRRVLVSREALAEYVKARTGRYVRAGQQPAA